MSLFDCPQHTHNHSHELELSSTFPLSHPQRLAALTRFHTIRLALRHLLFGSSLKQTSCHIGILLSSFTNIGCHIGILLSDVVLFPPLYDASPINLESFTVLGDVS